MQSLCLLADRRRKSKQEYQLFVSLLKLMDHEKNKGIGQFSLKAVKKINNLTQSVKIFTVNIPTLIHGIYFDSFYISIQKS